MYRKDLLVRSVSGLIDRRSCALAYPNDLICCGPNYIKERIAMLDRGGRRTGIFRFSRFEVDVQRMELRRDGAALPVQPRVLETLIHLLENRHRTVSKMELIEGPWRGTSVSDGALNQVISLAREAIDDDGERQQAIKTVRGHGFRFVADVQHEAPRTPSSGFVGRAEELSAIAGQLSQAVEGRGSLLLIEGEPGIGKTTLVQQAALEIGPRAVAHWGRCREERDAAPFSVWSEALGSLIATSDGPNARDLADVDRLLFTPSRRSIETADSRPELPAGPSARRAIFDAARRLVLDVSSEQTVLVVLEDLHTADEPSLLLLEFLASHVASARVLLVGTYRHTELSVAHPLQRQLDGALGGASRLRLHGFSRGDVATLLGSLGAPVDPKTFDSVHDLTGGNPFFVEQMVRAAQREGGLSLISSALHRVSVPERITNMVLGGLRALPEPTFALLGAAAIVGCEFELGLLRAIADSKGPETLDCLAPALAHGAVRERDVGRFEFRHALVQRCLHASLPPGERARLHHRAGVALVDQHRATADVPIERIAHHFFHAAPAGGATEALEYTTRAAREAQRRTAYEEAVLQLDRALRVLDFGAPDPKARGDLLIELGHALHCAGDNEKARAAFDRAYDVARKHGDTEQAARAVDAYAATQKGLVDVPLIERLSEVLSSLPEEDSIVRARVMACLARAGTFGSFVAHPDALAREATEMAERLGDPNTLKTALVSQLWCTRTLLAPLDRWNMAQKAVVAALAAGDGAAACDARIWTIHGALELGDRDAFTRELSHLGAEALALRHAYPAVVVARFRVVEALMHGRFAEAEALAEQAKSLGERMGEQATHVVYWVELSLLRREQGRIGEIEPFIRQLLELIPWDLPWKALLTVVLVETGRGPEAARLLDSFAADGFAGVARDVNWLVNMTNLAEACAALGHEAHARTLHDLLWPHRETHAVVTGGSLYRGPVWRYLGLLSASLGRLDDAALYFSRAIAACEGIGAVAWAAHLDLEMGQVLLRRGNRGDVASARKHLRRAREAALAMEMTVLAERSRELSKR
jgi:DNA-binding winged helix-turn-helix (wHTH) protein/tetratricopeptide (TPR) repeat protein